MTSRLTSRSLWVCCTHLGRPVLPLVYSNTAGSSPLTCNSNHQDSVTASIDAMILVEQICYEIHPAGLENARQLLSSNLSFLL